MKKGIDVSEHNSGFDYTTLSRNIDFVIIREGHHTQKDKLFLTHVNGFRAAKTPIIGVYHFIYALNSDAARKEAEAAIKHVQEAGLPKTTRIWADFEYDTVDKARANGMTLGPLECNLFTETFCKACEAAGYQTGIYTNIDYYKHWYTQDLLRKYPLWLADLDGDPDYACMIHQYNWQGRLPGAPCRLDMDYLMEEEKSVGITAEDALAVARSWIGRNESAGTHKMIIDLYNSHKPLARGYAVKYTDQWCDTCMSAIFIKLGATDLIGGTECGVEEHVKLFKKAGIWIEDGCVTPKPGDLIVYNWDKTTQPNDGYSDHIGIVESVSGKTITAIEGNYKDSVARRKIAVGHGQIRGYARPKYADKAPAKPDPVKPAEPTGSPSKTPKWVGRVTASLLNVRTWAGTENPKIKSWPQLAKGNLVDVCDTIKAKDGKDWYYVRIAGKYFGFVSSAYIKKA